MLALASLLSFAWLTSCSLVSALLFGSSIPDLLVKCCIVLGELGCTDRGVVVVYCYSLLQLLSQLVVQVFFQVSAGDMAVCY